MHGSRDMIDTSPSQCIVLLQSQTFDMQQRDSKEAIANLELTFSPEESEGGAGHMLISFHNICKDYHHLRKDKATDRLAVASICQTQESVSQISLQRKLDIPIVRIFNLIRRLPIEN